MRLRVTALRDEWRPMFRLAVPVVIAELGWMAMGVVDVMMVGRLGPAAIGGVGIGRAVFFSVTVFAIGLLLGLDTLVSQAWGARRIEECHRWLVHGLYVSLASGLPSTFVMRTCGRLLAGFGIDPGVLAEALPYLRAMSWSVLPLLMFTTFRRYLQGVSRARPLTVALISANVVNVAGNWVLIFGKLGAPALGAAGAGWSSCISSTYMALFLLFAVVQHDREEGGRLLRTSLALEPARVRRLLVLGFPAAVQLIAEVASFATGTALAGRLEPTWLAGHQVALIAVGVVFMVPLGLSSAGAVRVGQGIGRDDPEGAARAGWTAIVFAMTFMLAAALAFLLVPRPLVRLFSADEQVLAAGITLLGVAALFQLSDGVQVVATGNLRGTGDTRTPLLWNVVGHWILGLPLGYHLCFGRGWGAPGLWFGWLVGLTTIGAVLLAVWARTARSMVRRGYTGSVDCR